MHKGFRGNILLIGSFIFLTFFIMSTYFYKERTCFIDISLHLFHLLKDCNFIIQNNRFGALFTQMIPILGQGLNLSLKNIAILYSLSFVMLPFFSFLTIIIGLRNSKIAITYLFSILLMTTHTFFWIQSELPQAMSFFFILLALIDNCINAYKEITLVTWIGLFLLLIVTCFTHPLSIFPIGFAILFYFFQYKENRLFVSKVAILSICIVFLKSIFFKTEYDSQAIGQLIQNKKHIQNFFELTSTKNYIHYFSSDYILVTVSLLILTILYFYHKQLKLGLFILLASIGFSSIINLTYPEGALQFYIENQYQILAIIISIPLINMLFKRKLERELTMFLLPFVSIICFIRIISVHPIYTQRLDWYRNILKVTSSNSSKKLIISNKSAPIDTLLMTWASSYETWLISTIETDTSRSLLIEEYENEYSHTTTLKNVFVTKWGAFEYNTLPTRYFKFMDTTGYFRLQNY